MREWAGDGFDPELFDLKATNKRLQKSFTYMQTMAQAAIHPRAQKIIARRRGSAK